MKAFPTSLCGQCQYLREITAARSVFMMCEHGTPPKYPPQPVTTCNSWVPLGSSTS